MVYKLRQGIVDLPTFHTVNGNLMHAPPVVIINNPEDKATDKAANE